MVVYADILIVLNLIVNYFLLLATSKLLRRNVKVLPMLLSALAGAFSSLYIFLPKPSVIAELFFKVSVCFLMSAIAFGLRGIKQFLKASALLFAVTCGYAGIMMAVWHIFSPKGMIINNSVVYFDISPLILVGSSVAVYLVFVLLNLLFKRSAETAGECEISVTANEKNIKLKAILDSGNSLVDLFGKSEIIIADKLFVDQLFSNQNEEELKTRFRVIPCSTVSGDDVLEGYRCDTAFVSGENKTVTLQKPILAVSKTALNDGYNAIVNPKILE